MTSSDPGHEGVHDREEAAARAAEARAASALYALLDAHGLAWRHHEHAPVFTVEEARHLRGEIPGAHVKNMVLKEKKGGVWLVTCLEDRRIRIRDLERSVGARGWSFAKPEVLRDLLGVRPGAVTPFAAMNDRDGKVRVVLDAQMMAFERLNAHPLHNRATTTISPDDLRRFFEVTGHRPLIVDFDRLEAEAAARVDGGTGVPEG